MTADVASLETILSKPNSSKKILEFFRGMPEKERQVYAKHCAGWYKRQLNLQRNNMWREEASGGMSYNRNPLLAGAVLAAYCCCSFDVVKGGGWQARIDSELISSALSDRRPGWVNQWVKQAVSTAAYADWPDIRMLIRNGVCERPSEDNYIRLMIEGVSSKVKNVAAKLLADPELLEEDFWRIFEVPGVMRNSSLFGYLDDAWLTGIIELEKKKKLDRERLFQAVLSSPLMGFNQAQIKFFLDLHDKLKPSSQELKSRLADYAGLTDSPLAPVAKWSYDVVRTLDRREKLTVDALQPVLEAGMRSGLKSRVRETIAWIKELLKRDQKGLEPLCEIALVGLEQEKSDVQLEVWTFLSQHVPQTSAWLEPIQAALGHVSAPVRKAITQWLKESETAEGTPVSAVVEQDKKGKRGKSSKDVTSLAAELKKVPKRLRELYRIDQLLAVGSSDNYELPPTCFSGMEFQRLDPSKVQAPITSLDKLLEVATAVIEVDDRQADAERVIDALVRVAPDDSHPGFGPLKKRLGQLFKRLHGNFFDGCGHHVDLVAMLMVWGKLIAFEDTIVIDREYHRPGPVGLVGFLGIRNREIAEAIGKGQSVQLLGTLTHEEGWVDAEILVNRVKQTPKDGAMIEADQLLSLLRLAPDHRKSALKNLKRVKQEGEYIQALRYALGDEVQVGTQVGLWVAAARARDPFGDDFNVEKKFSDLGPDTGRVARYDFRMKKDELEVFAEGSPVVEVAKWDYPKRVRFDLPTLMSHRFGNSNKSAVEALDTKPEPRAMTNLAATVWPLNRDSFYAHRYLPSDDLDPLFDPCTPLNAPQMHALISSLVSGYVVYAPEVAAATDLAIVAISDGRYDAKQAGKYLAIYMESVQRFTKGLTAISRVSPLHTFQVLTSILAIFDHKLPKKVPTRISDLFMLLWELVQELEIQLPAESVRVLAKWSEGTSKTAKLVKQIVAYVPETPFDIQPLVEQAIRARLDAPRVLLDQK